MARAIRDYSWDEQRDSLVPRPPARPLEENDPTHVGRAGDRKNEQIGNSRSTRVQYIAPDRQRSYALHKSELETLAEIGTFRALMQSDLTKYRYGGSEVQALRDLDDLARQGLIRRRTTYPERGVYVSLTRDGHRLTQAHRLKDSDSQQRLYHGFVKTREAKHDASLYRLYQQEIERIQRAGGKVNRVVLDFELKRSLNRRLATLDSFPEAERAKRKQEIAHEHSLRVVNGKIAIPDLRLEWEGPDHEQTKVDLELATGHYHHQNLTAKAQAGFLIYALAADAARLRPAMPDPEIMQEILSL